MSFDSTTGTLGISSDVAGISEIAPGAYNFEITAIAGTFNDATIAKTITVTFEECWIKDEDFVYNVPVHIEY